MTEQEGYMIEAALQHGFTMTNDDGDEFACSTDQLISLMSAVIGVKEFIQGLLPMAFNKIANARAGEEGDPLTIMYQVWITQFNDGVWKGDHELPDEKGWYLITRKNGSQCVRAYGNGHWWIQMKGGGWLSDLPGGFTWFSKRICGVDYYSRREGDL